MPARRESLQIDDPVPVENDHIGGIELKRANKWGAATLSVIFVALTLGGSGYLLSSRDDPESIGVAHGNTFDGYAAAVIEETPEGWLVPGESVLVLPDGAVDETTGTLLSDDRVGKAVDLPSRLFEPVQEWTPEGEEPEKSDEESGMVVADRGPALLACTDWDDAGACEISLGHTDGDQYVHDLLLGSEDFQKKGHGMEVFLMPSYTRFGEETLLVAGSDKPADSAVVVMTDGSKVDLEVTNKIGKASGSISFGRIPGVPKRVVTYDATGKIVTSHRIRSCQPGENCEIR